MEPGINMHSENNLVNEHRSERPAAYAKRWAALILVVVNIVFNYINESLMKGNSMAEITDRYNSLFTPAGYAFSIWGLIYLAQLVYVIYQLLPSQENKSVHNYLAGPLILSTLAGICWIVLFRKELLGLSVVCIILMLITSLIMLIRVKYVDTKQNKWLTVPFSLYAGWLSVAVIANISLWFKSTGWTGGHLGEEYWTIIMIVVAGLIGMVVSYRWTDIAFPLMIAWAAFAIWVKQQYEYDLIAITALGTAISVILWSTFSGIIKKLLKKKLKQAGNQL